jgi:hypothetical protein
MYSITLIFLSRIGTQYGGTVTMITAKKPTVTEILRNYSIPAVINNLALLYLCRWGPNFGKLE